MHARIEKLAVLALCAVALCLPPAAAALELGDLIFDTPPAKPLAISRTAGSRFLRQTGGIAFANVAEGRNGIAVSRLVYDPAAPDGSRLSITITQPDGSTQAVAGELFDWELVPVAQHALDTNDAAFTYFGELESSEREREALADRFRILNYHKAFENTLLGLRLMQLDFLMISALQRDAMYLPKEAGKTILGNGEAEYLQIIKPGADIEAGVRQYEQENFARLEAFKARADSIINNQSYRSYVAGDYARASPVFKVNSAGELEFSSGIYWYFWTDPEAAAIEANIDFYNQMVRLYNYFEGLEDADALPAAEAAGLSAEDQARYFDFATQAINKSAEKIKKQAARLDGINADSDRETTELPEVSRQLNQYLREYQGLNPLILRAGDRAAWYSALFRHFKARDPEAYKAFVKSLDGVAVLPQVTTPTLVKAIKN